MLMYVGIESVHTLERGCIYVYLHQYLDNTSERWDTFRYIGWTLDKPKGFLVHLLSRVDSLGGNLIKLCKIMRVLLAP